MPLVSCLALMLARWVPTHIARRISDAQFRWPIIRMFVGRVTSGLEDRPVPIARGIGHGLLIAGSTTNLGYRMGTTEPELQALLARELTFGDVFYDLGANVGFFTLLAARLVGPGGRVVAVEPAPNTARKLQRNVDLNSLANVTVVEAAISACVGTGRLAIGDSSLDTRLTSDTGVAIDTVSLDHGVQRLGWPAPNVIKMDIEGAEVSALAGMTAIGDSSCPVIIIEVHWCRGAVLRQLHSMGYTAEAYGDTDILALEQEAHGHLIARKSPQLADAVS